MKKAFLLLPALVFTFPLFAQLSSYYAGTANTPGSNTTGVTLSNAKFDEPYGIAIDTNENIYVSNNNGHTIMILTAGYAYTRAGSYGNSGFYDASGVTSKFSNPRGIAVGPDNALYVADFGNHVIRRVSPFTSPGNAQSVTVFSGKYSTGSTNYTSYPGYVDGNAATAQFRNPSGICMDDTGNIYVADYGNHVIRKVNPSGSVITLAGSAGNTGSTDGKAKTQAKFNYPTDVYLVGNKLYITDMGNSRIRMLDLTKDSVFTVSSSSLLWTPTEIISLNNELYFSDQHRILKHSGYTQVYSGSTTLNISGYVNGYGNSSRYYSARGLVYLPVDSLIYMADMSNHVIRKLSVCPNISNTITASGKTTFCDGDSVKLSGPTGYAYYLWSSGEKSSSITVKKSGTYYLTLKNADSCSAISNSISVTVNKVPTSAFTIDSTFCLNMNDTINYTGNAGTTASFNWNFDNASVSGGSGKGPYILNWSSTGSKTVSLTVTENSCTSATTSKTINVYSIPSASFSTKNKLCVNEYDTVSFTGTAGSSATFTWDFNGGVKVSGSGSGPYVVYWISAGKKSLSVVVKEHNCISNTYKTDVDVYSNPVSNFTLNTSICGNDTALLTFTGTAGSTATFNWNFDKGTVISGSGAGLYQLSWSSTGNKQVSLLVEENGCYSGTINKNILVKQVPTSEISLIKSICTVQPDTVKYIGNASSSATYNWDWGTAMVFSGSGQGPYIIYWTSAGQKFISVQVSENGCESDIHYDTINVGTAVTSDFTIKTTVCENEPTTVTYTGNGSGTATYNWSFDGADIISGSGKGPYSVSWKSQGNKQVSLVVVNAGCSSDKTMKSVKVNPLPTSSFTIKPALCAGQHDTVKFTGTAGTSAVYTWNFNGATILSGTGKGPYILYWTTSGQKTVSLQVSENGCTSALTSQKVDINEGAVPDFDLVKSLCENEITTVTFTGTAGSSAIYYWDFDSAEIISGSGQGPYQVKWLSADTKTVTLAIEENNCTSTPLSKNVTVNKAPTSSFSADKTICTGLALDITYTGDAIPVATFTWNFDGGIIQSGSGMGPYKIRWNTSGTKNISLEVTQNACKSVQTSIIVEVLPLPAKPSITQNKDTLFSSADEGNQWYDLAGIINGANQKFFKAPESGIYHVVVTDSNGCSNSSDNYNYIKVSLPESTIFPLNIFPNPVSGLLTIIVPNEITEEKVVALYSLEGKIVMEKHEYSNTLVFDVSSLPEGIYILQLIAGDKLSHVKVIKR